MTLFKQIIKKRPQKHFEDNAFFSKYQQALGNPSQQTIIFSISLRLHEASGPPYVRKRLITVGQNHLARTHVNPLVEHTINSARINIAWDKYKHQFPYLNHQTDLLTPTTGRKTNEITSLNMQPLILKVVVWPVHRHVWQSPRTWNQKPTRLPGGRFYRCYKHPTMAGPQRSHLTFLHHFLTTTVYLQ